MMNIQYYQQNTEVEQTIKIALVQCKVVVRSNKQPLSAKQIKVKFHDNLRPEK